MANFVQIFKNTDVGAPTCAGTVNSLRALLDACLVNGYSGLSVTGITRSGTTATATLAAANTTLRTGDFVLFVGAGQADYNVTAKITVNSSTSISYQVNNAPATPATGTLFYAKAGLAWTAPFTGTNKSVYRSADTASNQFYLRIEDNALVNVREAYARGYETMSDVNTGTGPFPTVAQQANGVTWNKSATADGTGRSWTLVGDDKTFYLVINNGVTTFVMGFGHFISYKPSDGFNTFLGGAAISNLTVSTAGAIPATCSGIGTGCAVGATVAPTTSLYIARNYAQTGGGQLASAYDGVSGPPATSGSTKGALGGNSIGIVYPNGPDSGLWIEPVYIADFTSTVFNVRGRFPGLYAHMHNALPQSNYDLLTGVNPLTGVTLTALTHDILVGSANYSSGMIHVDITGPWTP